MSIAYPTAKCNLDSVDAGSKLLYVGIYKELVFCYINALEYVYKTSNFGRCMQHINWHKIGNCY